MKRRYLALDVGGTKIEAGLVREDGRVLASHRVPAPKRCTLRRLLAGLDAALAPVAGGTAEGLGAGFPALGDYRQGILHHSSLFPCVEGFAMGDHLARRYGIPVRMATDANVFALGVARFGEGRRYANFLALSLGTGLGVGLIRDGRLDGGSRGVPDAVLRILQEPGRPLWAAGHHFERAYGSDGLTLALRAAEGEPHATEAFRTIGSSLAAAIRGLIAVLPPLEAVIIGGGVSRSWRFFAPELRRELRDLDVAIVRTRLRRPALAGGAALFGGD